MNLMSVLCFECTDKCVFPLTKACSGSSLSPVIGCYLLSQTLFDPPKPPQRWETHRCTQHLCYFLPACKNAISTRTHTDGRRVLLPHVPQRSGCLRASHLYMTYGGRLEKAGGLVQVKHRKEQWLMASKKF